MVMFAVKGKPKLLLLRLISTSRDSLFILSWEREGEAGLVVGRGREEVGKGVERWQAS